MATKFEELVNEMVNVSFGVAAAAVEKTQEVIEDLSAKGEQVRKDKDTPDFARSMSDIFEQAGGTFSEVTDRLSEKGASAAERVLDELILARCRALDVAGRAAFLAHVKDLIDSLDTDAEVIEVEAEVVSEPVDADAADAAEE